MFSEPQKNIEHLGLLPGMRVADFGTGSGFYTRAAAKIIGGSGHVYSVDIQKDLLTALRNQTRAEKLFNVEVVWGDLEKTGGSKIRPFSVDAVIIANLIFQIENKAQVASEAVRVLKPKGKILVVDWTGSFGGIGPHPNQVVPENSVIDIFTKAGCEKIRSFSAGAHHYGIIFQKKQ